MKEYSIEDWFEKYERDITSFLIYYTGFTDVEDLVQDTFLIAMNKLSKFKGNSHPKTWLIAIARNIVIDRYRRKKVWQRIRHYFIADREQVPGSEDIIIQSLEQRQLYDAIDRLSSQQKEVVILRGILELSSNDTGEILKCSPNNVNVTYHRALKKLKEFLEEEGFDLEGNGANQRKSKEPS
ncbi:RNA polymerase sigma factor [Siminovitchia terrae]|uniref:RNA polymerase sigma factor n=1 Tax=Siminovitchia terrae TaxID=1914933 RepID=A0A429XD27_SIMTE|nr:sigma-70 family RNA polymerase sigma factor [Siminovitchia terrae]RST61366.1 sigma-70 family RNA polymerase sigma factor [Siminovitchia terrae]GIN89528.1 RNA polymerase sigma factor [Siminovitchia terrae]GIN96445.1 RNA polymerase sigma factor [Siminovitchia terrae]